MSAHTAERNYNTDTQENGVVTLETILFKRQFYFYKSLDNHEEIKNRSGQGEGFHIRPHGRIFFLILPAVLSCIDWVDSPITRFFDVDELRTVIP